MALLKIDWNKNLVQVTWGGLINPGIEPDDERVKVNFTGGKGLIYHVGYVSKRVVHFNGKSIDITCSVLKSNGTEMPLFKCEYSSESSPNPVVFTAMNPTKATNNVLKSIGKCLHKWSGNDFFGFRRNDVVNKNVTVECCKIVWVGIVSFGIPIINNPRYIYSVGSNNLRLQPGFESVRNVNGNDIHCQVVKTDVGPQFKCFLESDSVIGQSTKPTIAMNEILKNLGISKRRNLSGYEFFGFNRSDVLKVIKAPIEVYKDPLLKTLCDGVNDADLECTGSKKSNLCFEKLSAIMNRNAGPTSELKNTKSQKSRNAAIYDSVKLVSFDDVESMYICQFYINIFFAKINSLFQVLFCERIIPLMVNESQHS